MKRINHDSPSPRLAEFAFALKAARRARKWSQEEAVDAAGTPFHSVTLSKMELGQVEPLRSDLEAFERAFGRSVGIELYIKAGVERPEHPFIKQVEAYAAQLKWTLEDLNAKAGLPAGYLVGLEPPDSIITSGDVLAVAIALGLDGTPAVLDLYRVAGHAVDELVSVEGETDGPPGPGEQISSGSLDGSTLPPIVVDQTAAEVAGELAQGEANGEAIARAMAQLPEAPAVAVDLSGATPPKAYPLADRPAPAFNDFGALLYDCIKAFAREVHKTPEEVHHSVAQLLHLNERMAAMMLEGATRGELPTSEEVTAIAAALGIQGDDILLTELHRAAGTVAPRRVVQETLPGIAPRPRVSPGCIRAVELETLVGRQVAIIDMQGMILAIDLNTSEAFPVSFRS